MQTLSFHSHFGPILGADMHYQRVQFQVEASQPGLVNRPSNNKEKVSIKAQDQHQSKTNSNSAFNKENEKPVEENISALNAIGAPAQCADAAAPEREYFIRCIVLGARNTGKHTLINKSLGANGDAQTKNHVDLIMKEKTTFKTTKKYHFWTKTLEEASEMKEAIWKTYYKWATAFIFVYDITNKESFDALEKAVQDVLRVVPREKFFGVLVANKNDLNKETAVSYNSAIEFKQKYNFSHFIETNSDSERENSQVLSKIDTQLKLTFESI